MRIEDFHGNGIKELTAAIVHVHARSLLSDLAFLRNTMSVQTYINNVTGQMVVDLKASVLAMPTRRVLLKVQYPADWWQAFRARWFPAWWLRRWPIEYEVVEVDEQLYGAICPHVDVKVNAEHFKWLAQHAERNGE